MNRLYFGDCFNILKQLNDENQLLYKTIMPHNCGVIGSKWGYSIFDS
jgi:hypothetical protein